MKLPVLTLDNKSAGDVELNDAVFGVEVRQDIMHRMVRYQLAKRRAGTHKTKTVSEVSGTTKKPFKQKGTGRARQGSLRSVQMRGGGQIHKPVVRSHAIDLPKKVRKLALKSALSLKASTGNLVIVDSLELKAAKTGKVRQSFAKMGVTSAFVVDAATSENFTRAVANLYNVNVVPHLGANVYDILRHEKLVLTKAAIEQLEARLA